MWEGNTPFTPCYTVYVFGRGEAHHENATACCRAHFARAKHIGVTQHTQRLVGRSQPA